MNTPSQFPQRELHQSLGARPIEGGRTRFCVWAPQRESITVELITNETEPVRAHPMVKADDGYHIVTVDRCPVGTRYGYRIDGGPRRPDPASRHQPDGVHGPSEVVHRDFAWSDQDWLGVERGDLIIYELHIGALTAPGTFAAAIDRLDELVELGITAVELMPVSASAGRWNWGYDGVHWFAPLTEYGHPNDLRRFVDAAHAKGLAVILDVVYNHLGPEGNYLGDYGSYLSDRHQTVWGAAPNFDGPQHGGPLRRFVIANALHWYDEYHIDALRVDAIHCMIDDTDPHIVVELARAVDDWSTSKGRPAMLIAESNVYDAELITATKDGGTGFDAEWCDDFLHSVFAVVRPGEHLCHRTYEPTDLKQTLEKGYIYSGRLREQDGRRQPKTRIDTRGLVYSIQHHDFIGNHPLGKRLHQLTSVDTQRAAAALLLLSPAIPMLFMGEEFCSEQPFQFFVDFGDEHLRTSVVQGRQREYPQHDWSDGILPTDEQAFLGSKIGEIASGNPDMRKWYRELIKLRKDWRASGLLSDKNLSVTTDIDTGLYIIRYESASQFATVAVRLSANTNATDAVPIKVTGELKLNSRINTQPKHLQPNQAQIFASFTPPETKP